MNTISFRMTVEVLRRVARFLRPATILAILTAASILHGAGRAAAQAPGEGPVPLLAGTWQSQAPNNNYVIRVGWNAATGRYEGVMVRQGNLSARSGLVLGQVCWMASPVINQAYLQGAEQIGQASPVGIARPRWRQGPVRLDPRNPNILFSGPTRFVRVGPPPPVVPVRAAAGPPASPFVPMRPGEKPAADKARPGLSQPGVAENGSAYQGRPAGAAPAPASSPAGSGIGKGPNPPWVGELPTVAAVHEAIHGTSSRDTAIRVSAALEVLEYFVYVLSGNSDPGPGRSSLTWPDAGRRREEYRVAGVVAIRKMIAAEPPPRPGSREAGNPEFFANIEKSHLSEDRKFAVEVLSKFFSKASQDAYFAAAANWYERGNAISAAVETKRGNGSATDIDCANARVSAAYGDNSPEAKQLRARCGAGRQAEAERASAERFVADDLAKARSAGVSLSVFGVPLGQPFTIADCPKIDMFTMTTKEVLAARAATPDTCRVQRTEGPLDMLAMMLEPESVDYSEITLGASKRPSWVTSAGMMIKGGLVMAVAIATTDENQKDQIATLRAKYGKPQPQSVDDILEWRLPGLYVRFQDRASIPQPPNQITAQTINGVTYSHVGPNAGAVMLRARKPNLFIMLEGVHKSQAARKAAQKAAEPTL